MADPFDTSEPTGNTQLSSLPSLLNEWARDMETVFKETHGLEWGTETKVRLAKLLYPVGYAELTVDTNDGTWTSVDDTQFGAHKQKTLTVTFPNLKWVSSGYSYVLWVTPLFNSPIFLGSNNHRVDVSASPITAYAIVKAIAGTGKLGFILLRLYPVNFTFSSWLNTIQPYQQTPVPNDVTGADVVNYWRNIRNVAYDYLTARHDATSGRHKFLFCSPTEDMATINPLQWTSPLYAETIRAIAFNEQFIGYSTGAENTATTQFDFTFTNLPADGTKICPIVTWLAAGSIPWAHKSRVAYRRFRWTVIRSSGSLTFRGVFDGGIAKTSVVEGGVTVEKLITVAFNYIGVRALLVQVVE